MDRYKLSLLRGSVIKVYDIHIKPLTLGEIEEIGIDKYYRLLNICTLKKSDFFDGVSNEVLDKLSLFDVFTMTEANQNLLIEFLYMFVLSDGIDSINYVGGCIDEFSIYYQNEIGRINRYNLEEIFSLIRKIYCIPDTVIEKDKYVDEEAAEAFREFEEWEATLPQPKTTINIGSIVQGLVSRNRFTFDDVWDKTVYQIMSVYYGVNKEDNYLVTMNGIYSGTVDSKQIKLDELNWAVEIDD